MQEVTHFCLPGLLPILKNTVQFVSEVNGIVHIIMKIHCLAINVFLEVYCDHRVGWWKKGGRGPELTKYLQDINWDVGLKCIFYTHVIKVMFLLWNLCDPDCAVVQSILMTVFTIMRFSRNSGHPWVDKDLLHVHMYT